MEVQYVKLDTPELLQVYLHPVVRCYQEVYAAAPWNEWMKCPHCQKKWGISERAELVNLNFRHHGRIVEDYWPTEDLKAKIQGWQKLPGSSFWIVVVGAEVIGFGIGYPRTVAEIQTHELLLDVPELLRWDVTNQTRIAYLKDVGILPEYRGRKYGIFSELNRRRFNDLLRVQDLKIVTCRTQLKPEATRVYHKYLACGFQVLASYGKDDGRVFMACRTADLTGTLALF